MNNNLKNSFPDTPVNFHNKVMEVLDTLPEKRGNNMRIFSFKKVAVIAAVLTMLTATTVFAISAGKAYTLSKSSSQNEFNNFNTLSEVSKDIGVTPKLIESFANGYDYDSSRIVKSENYDETGSKIESYNNLGMVYKKGDAIVNFSIGDEKFFYSEVSTKNETITTVNGISVKTKKVVYKFVPDGYVMTEEEIAAEMSGEMCFSLGAGDSVTEKVTTFLNWKENGVSYLIFSNDVKVPENDLMDIAKEIINSK